MTTLAEKLKLLSVLIRYSKLSFDEVSNTHLQPSQQRPLIVGYYPTVLICSAAQQQERCVAANNVDGSSGSLQSTGELCGCNQQVLVMMTSLN